MLKRGRAQEPAGQTGFLLDSPGGKEVENDCGKEKICNAQEREPSAEDAGKAMGRSAEGGKTLSL